MKMYKKRTKKGRVFALFLALMLMMAPAFSSYAVEPTDEQTSEQTSAEGESKVEEELGETEEEPKAGEETGETEEDLKAEEELGKIQEELKTEEEAGKIQEEPKAGEEPINTGDIVFRVMDKSGSYINVDSIKKEDVKSGQTFREAGITLPAVSSSYPGLQFVGWMDEDGKEITEDSPIVFKKFYFAGSPTASAATFWIMNIYAKYDKGVIQVSYRYPDSHGKWKGVSDSKDGEQKVVFDYGCTYAEFLDCIKAYKPEDMTDQYQFVGWELYSPLQKETDVVNGGAHEVVQVIAKFRDVNLLQVDYNYITSEGRNNWDRYYGGKEFDAVAVKEGASVDDVLKMLSASVPPETYKGLRFEKWDITEEAVLDRNRAENGQQFSVRAFYENYLVRYFINDNKDEKQDVFCQLAEKGETISTLTEFGNWKDITWRFDTPRQMFVVKGDKDFWGTGTYSSTDTTAPSKPSDSTRPSNPSSGSASNGATGSTSGAASDTQDNPYVTPESKLPQSIVNSAVEAVNAANPGQEIRINMNTKTTISKEILEAAQGKDVNLTLEMDGYSWTIKGKNIQSMNLQDINLKVLKNTNHIPGSTVRSLAGDNPCMQLSLVHEGNFGFQAILNIGVGAEYSGKYGNLYYYDRAGKMVFMNAGQIDSNGYVNLSFSHASDYLIVMSDQMMSQTSVPSQLMPSGTAQSGNEASTSVSANSAKSVKTGDKDKLYPWLLLCIAAVGTIVYQFRKKQV